MSLLRRRTLAVLAACTFALAGCSADRQSSFAPSSSSDAALAPADPAILNVAGQYAGSVNDGSLAGHARASISQYGGSIGGPIAYAFPSQKRANSAAGTLQGSSLRGTMVATVGSVACTFKFSASYDNSAHTLNGSYRAVHDCTGDSGTFTLNEKCYYVLRADLRRDVGGLKPC